MRGEIRAIEEWCWVAVQSGRRSRGESEAGRGTGNSTARWVGTRKQGEIWDRSRATARSVGSRAKHGIEAGRRRMSSAAGGAKRERGARQLIGDRGDYGERCVITGTFEADFWKKKKSIFARDLGRKMVHE